MCLFWTVEQIYLQLTQVKESILQEPVELVGVDIKERNVMSMRVKMFQIIVPQINLKSS
jgi:hypothetical protein